MVCKVLYYIVPEISGEGIESCPEKWWAIVKFSKRKDCEHVIRIKKDLKNLNPTDFNLLVGTMLMIATNDSLCHYYKVLWNYCKKFSNNQVCSFFTVNDTLRIKLHQDDPYNRITHLNDLKDHNVWFIDFFHLHMFIIIVWFLFFVRVL